jgi:hypothetical protein
MLDKKICPKCNIEKPIEDFRTRQRSEDNTTTRSYTNCKSCEQKINTLLIKLRKESPQQPENCECCGKKTDKLYLDHCHNLNTFRGWICNNCNVGLSRLGDNIDGLVKALNYLLSR